MGLRYQISSEKGKRKLFRGAKNRHTVARLPPFIFPFIIRQSPLRLKAPEKEATKTRGRCDPFGLCKKNNRIANPASFLHAFCCFYIRSTTHE